MRNPRSSVGRMWGIPTPNIDVLVWVASTMFGVDFFTKALTVKDPRIEGMSREEVKAFLE